MARPAASHHSPHHHRHSPRTGTYDNELADLQSTVSNLSRRMAGLASVKDLEELENRLRQTEALFIQTANDANRDISVAIEKLSRRMDGICAMADKTQDRFRGLIEDKTGALSTELAELAKKQRKIVDKTNRCIDDIKTIRKEYDQAQSKGQRELQLSVTDLDISEEQEPRTEDTNEPGYTSNPGEDEDLYWKSILQRSYRLPEDVDLAKVRVDNERGTVLCNRVRSRNYYLDRNKMDFTGRRATVRREHVREFLLRVKEDCPAVKIGKTGRPYRLRI